MKFRESMLLLYAVTNRTESDRKIFFEQVEQALRGGVTLLQLREKNLSETEFTDEAIQVRQICRRYGVPLIINDNLTVALNSKADGIHVGAGDLPVEEIRRKTGKDFIIGATAKTPEQAKAAERAGADYLGVGAVFPSPTKQNAIQITPEQLREITRSVSIPAVAIGGISEERIPLLRGSGVKGIAAVSALFSAENIKTAAEKLQEKTREMLEG